jgi:hypothetical protein
VGGFGTQQTVVLLPFPQSDAAITADEQLELLVHEYPPALLLQVDGFGMQQSLNPALLEQ